MDYKSISITIYKNTNLLKKFIDFHILNTILKLQYNTNTKTNSTSTLIKKKKINIGKITLNKIINLLKSHNKNIA